MDDHRRGDTLEQGVGPLGGGKPLGGGAELAALALDFDRTRRWTATLLGALLTVTVLFARAPRTPAPRAVAFYPQAGP